MYDISFILRLAAYERNAGFNVNPVIILPSTPLPNWPSDGFNSIGNEHQDLIPPITEESIEEYFISRQLKAEILNPLSWERIC